MPESGDVVSTLDPEMEDGFEGDDFDGDDQDDTPVTAQASEPPAPAPSVAAPASVSSEPPAAPAPVAAAPAVAVPPAAERVAAADAPAAPATDLASLAIQATHELLSLMGFDAVVTARAEGTRVDVVVEVGQDDDLLTGYKGETRMALEHLLNRFINRGEGSRYHLQLEVNDYWLKREGELAEMAKQLAEKAVAEHAEVVTDLMNSQERRIVHVTLREDSRVKTYSQGHDRTKRVSIVPADFPDPTEEHAG